MWFDFPASSFSSFYAGELEPRYWDIG